MELLMVSCVWESTKQYERRQSCELSHFLLIYGGLDKPHWLLILGGFTVVMCIIGRYQ